MSRFDLDRLVRGLQDAAGDAQRALRGRQEGLLKAIADAGGEGKPDELMGVPVISLQYTRMMEISELSLEFDCKIEKSPQKEVRGSSKLVVTPRRRARRRKRGVHNVKITLRDLDTGEGDVTLDGVVLGTMNERRSRSASGEGGCESSCLLSEDELYRLLHEDGGRAKRWFQRKTLLVCSLIGLLMAAIVILVIRMGS